MQENFIFCLLGFFLLIFVHCKASIDCEQSYNDACGDDTYAASFPETEEELELYCKYAIDSYQCFVDFEEKCKKEDFNIETESKILEYLKIVCSKNHPLYTALVDNLKCVKSVVDSEACYEHFPSEETFRNYSKALLDRGIDAFPGDETDDIECLGSYFYIAYRAQEMEKCGKTAVDAFITFYQKVTSILVYGCGDKVGTYLPEIISVMNGKEV